jgi:NAD(P)-dependent dehydrogenase (short-subunit alcohol dehydrogenase family)
MRGLEHKVIVVAGGGTADSGPGNGAATAIRLADEGASVVVGDLSGDAAKTTVAIIEDKDRAQRGLERRLKRSRLERFKPMADYDWNWPTKIDRPLVESVVRLDFLDEPRNVVLAAAQGLGKTMIAQNVAQQAVLRGHGVLFISAGSFVKANGRVLNVLADILELHSPRGNRTSRVHHRQEESMRSKGKHL